MGCVSVLKCERRCSFSCLHFERISDFLFRKVFCDGYVIWLIFHGNKEGIFLIFCCRQILVLVYPR